MFYASAVFSPVSCDGIFLLASSIRSEFCPIIIPLVVSIATEPLPVRIPCDFEVFKGALESKPKVRFPVGALFFYKKATVHGEWWLFLFFAARRRAFTVNVLGGFGKGCFVEAFLGLLKIDVSQGNLAVYLCLNRGNRVFFRLCVAFFDAGKIYEKLIDSLACVAQ